MHHFSFMFPSVWTHSSTLRFGIDRPELTLRVEHRAEAILLQRIREGVSEHALRQSAETLDICDTRVTEILEQLARVLRPEQQPLPAFQLLDHYQFGTHVRRALHHAGFPLAPRSGTHSHTSSFAVTIERFGYDIARATVLQSHGHVQLPVRLTDSSVSIGPWIQPKSTCLRCLHLNDLDAGLPWLQWPEQLLGRTVPFERTHAVQTIAALTTNYALETIRTTEQNTQLLLEVTPHGDIRSLRRDQIDRHPACEDHSDYAWGYERSANHAA